MKCYTLLLAIMGCIIQSTAMAQVVDDAKFYSCLRQSGKVVKPYDMRESNGSVSGYRFHVNDLFTAGMCRGQAPLFGSYNWNLCDFKGPAALANHIGSVDQLLERPDMQDRIIHDIIVKKSVANRNLILDSDLSDVQRYRNGPDLLGSLVYRKGSAAVKLLVLTDINSADRLGYTVRDYIKFFGNCAGSNQVARERRLFDTDLQKKDQGTITAVQQQKAPASAQPLSWQLLNTLPESAKERILHKVPELRLVINTPEKHLYTDVQLPSTTSTDLLVRLTGADFCNFKACTYYFFRNNFKDVIIFYAGDVRAAPGQDGLYIDGFYKAVEEIGQ